MLAVAWSRDWGVRGVWLALVVLILVRLATHGARFLRRPLARHGLGKLARLEPVPHPRLGVERAGP